MFQMYNQLNILPGIHSPTKNYQLDYDYRIASLMGNDIILGQTSDILNDKNLFDDKE